MGSFTERISVLIDVATDKANTSIKNFRTSIADADGVTGKFKAGARSAFDTVKANAGAMSLAAGSALVAFGIKSVGAFNDLALAAGNFSDAAGISVEDASRWMEVAGDMGIDASTIEGSFLKLNAAIANGKPALKEYGVEIIKTKDGMVDTNATFQNAITTIGAIEDPTKRAKAAQELFGKSYKDVAEIMEMSAGELQTALEGVSDAKIIDQSELEKARDYRAAMDKLKDKLEDITLEVGEGVVPVLTDMAEAIGAISDATSLLGGDGLGGLLETAYHMSGLGTIVDGVNSINTAVNGTALEMDGLAGKVKAEAEANKKLDASADEAESSLRTFSDAGHEAAIAADKAEAATKRLTDTYNAFIGALDQEDAFADFQTAMFNYRSEIEHSDQSTRDYIRSLGETVMALDNIPEETKTQMIATLDQGNIDAIESRLNFIARDRTVSINGILVGSDLRKAMEGRAKGGSMHAGQPYAVGENPDGSWNSTTEVVVPGTNSAVVAANKLKGMGAGGTYIDNRKTYVNVQSITPEGINRLQARFDRRNGIQ